MRKRPLRMGLIGSGFAGRTMVYAARSATECVFTDVFGGKGAGDLARAARLTAHATLSSLLAAGVDAVAIASPHDSHAEYALAALRAGLHVFCEKPFVVSPAEGQRIVREARRRKRVLGVNHFQRNRLPNRVTRDAIRAGAIGRVVGIHQELLEPPMTHAWQSQASNLGFLFGYGVHAVDLQCWWLGARALRVLARCTRDRRGVEHGSLAVLEFPGGALGTILASDQRHKAQGAPGRAEFRARIIGTKGLLEVDSYGVATLSTAGGAKTIGALPSWRSFTSPRRLEAYRQTLEGFARAARRSANAPITGEDGLHNVEVCLAAYRSSASGDWECVSNR